ncbi:MAG: hypothetical protein ACREKB_19185, partial [Candidatus Rokuibacteriota bacterium]
IGTPPDRVSLLVALWRNRKAVKTLTLSASQVQRLYREGVIDAGQATNRLSALGYNAADVKDLIALAKPDIAEAEPPDLSLAQLRQALNAELLTEPEVRQRLAARGFSAADIDLLLELWTVAPAAAEPAELAKADLRALLKAKLIDQAEAERRLKARGFAAADVTLLLKLWTGAAA